MKTLPLFALLFSLSALGSSTLTTFVGRYSFPLKDGEQAQDILCVDRSWRTEDMVVSTLLQKLKKQEPRSVEFRSGEPFCFDKLRLSAQGQEDLVSILNRISAITDSQITLPVDLDHDKTPEISDWKPMQLPGSHSFETPDFKRSEKPLLSKLLRGSALIQGTQVLGLGILMVVPPEISKWDSPISPIAGENLKTAWTKAPVWDHDKWQINYVGHPMAGSLYYNAVRSQGASPLVSFLFSSTQSFIWEYGFEAINERPSIQDLLFTSTIGSLYGEGAHRATLAMKKHGFSTLEKIIVTVINPMYVINNGYKE